VITKSVGADNKTTPSVGCTPTKSDFHPARGDRRDDEAANGSNAPVLESASDAILSNETFTRF
jgi:hypothetical protein